MNTSSSTVASCAESMLAMLVAVAPPRKLETWAFVVGSKSLPFELRKFRFRSMSSALAVMDGLPLFVHQPLLRAFPPPRQILPKSRPLFAPAVALNVPSQHFEDPPPGAI